MKNVRETIADEATESEFQRAFIGSNLPTGGVASGLLVIRPESMPSAEITSHKPTLRYKSRPFSPNPSSS